MVRFQNIHLDDLIVFIDEYAIRIKDSQIKDRRKWNIGIVDFESDVMELKIWVNSSADFLEGFWFLPFVIYIHSK